MKVILFIVAIILISCVIFALPTWLLWNWLMPILFELPTITFFQAIGLNILCSMLFKSTSISNS